MGRLARFRNKEKDLIDKINSDPGINLRGSVKVQLMDADSGKVTHEQRGDNFISLNTVNAMKWWPKYLASYLSPNYTNNAAGFEARWMAPTYMNHIACWNDTSAEDSATEIGIQKPIIAWASRYPFAAPTSTSRGQINTSTSTASPTQALWVFDWTPSQGNGTFQSVGWTKMVTTYGLPFTNVGRDFSTSNILDFTTSATLTTFVSKAIYWDGTYFNIIDNNSTNFILKRYTTSGGAADATVFSIPTTTNAFNGSTCSLLGICKISTDWFLCGRNASNQATVQKLNSSGVSQWIRNESTTPASQNYYTDITSDGTNLWASCSDGKIYRLSTSDGTVAATITPSTPGVSNAIQSSSLPYYGVTGIAYDANDGYMWVTAFAVGALAYTTWKINPATGAVVDSPQAVHAFAGGNFSETSLTPYAGTAYTSPGPMGNYAVVTEAGTVAASSSMTTTNLANGFTTSGSVGTGGHAPPFASTTYGAGSMTMKGTDVWSLSQVFGGTLGAYNRAARLYPFENLGTRKLLGSPVVKDSTHAMRITYEFDYT